MSMLAEPRRKQKIINLRAKNNAWSNDSTKFGQRMLEKMGWSDGKGLGAKEDGIVEHVIAKYKNDEKGLGFKDNSDQWTKHEDDFNSLLANLGNGDSKGDKLHSGTSLETISKKSKARVHYHKFTRGKDLSRYSEKDLANIFGKKSFKENKTIEEPTKEDVKTTEQVFTEKGSMEDYFKNKLALLKNKTSPSSNNKNIQDDDDEADYGFQGFSGTNNDTELENEHQAFGFQSSSFYGTPISNAVEINGIDKENMVSVDVKDFDGNIDNIKKKKKKKKSENQVIETIDNIVNNSVDIIEKNEKLIDNDNDFINLNDIDEDVQLIKNKKSKKKYSEHQHEIQESQPKKKKSKNRTNHTEEILEDVVDDISHIPKKKKKRKDKNIEE